MNYWTLFLAMLAAMASVVEAAEPVWTITEGIGAPSHPLYDPDSDSLFVTQLFGLPKGIGGIEYVASRQLLIVAEVTENRISAYDLAPMLKIESR